MHARARSLLVVAAALIGGWPGRGAAQAAPSGAAEQTPERMGDAAPGEARDAQARFERERLRWLPVNPDGGGGPCDEVLGRMCLREDSGGDWYPTAEDPRIAAAREDLLRALADAAARAPADPWILGQRVFYLGEAGRWDEALALAREASCPSAGGWCRALEGLALHALARFPEAEAAFRHALAAMEEGRAREWSDPRPLLDDPGRGWWSGLGEDERSRRAPLVWALADPLLLVPGNDLLTEHWSRWTTALIRERARNPYAMRWASDLEQLLVRYGWEVGWERVPVSAVGHHHPESRPLFPPGAALADPASASEAQWTPRASTARSAYAPAYAPVLLPGAGQVVVFPRGDRIVVIGTYALPEDTTHHARHQHPTRDSVPPLWRDRPDEAGLFLLSADDPVAPPHEVRVAGTSSGRLLLEAPAGRWVASLEVLSPGLRRAGRTRVGIERPPLPADLFTLSDLLLVDSALPAGASLNDAASRALGRTWVRSGERFGVAWELFGLGYREEGISYRLTVAKDGEGMFRRAIRLLRLSGPERQQRLEWEEPAPDRPGPDLRSIELELPPLPPGSYRLRLEVLTSGRAAVVRDLPIELRPQENGALPR